MKNKALWVLGLSAALIPTLSLAAAATATLTNGGLGQVANDPQHFGVAVCNAGKTTLTSMAPVSVAVGGQTAVVTSAAPLKAGACAYSYLLYSQLGMQPGAIYSVTVTIDPAHTIATNKNNQAVYNVTVPHTPVAVQSAQVTPQTANADVTSGNLFDTLFGWLTRLLSGK